MANVDVSSIKVQVISPHRHHWLAGQMLRHEPDADGGLSFYYTLWFIQQGIVEVESEKGSWRLQEGEAFLVPTRLARVIRTPVVSEWLSIRARISIFNQFNLLRGLPLPIQWTPGSDERYLLETWMEQIIVRYRENDVHHRLIVESLSNALLGLCWPHISSVPLAQFAQGELPHWLVVTLNQLMDNPATTINALARDAGLSPAQFRRSFHKWLGIAPSRYLIAHRLETARRLLEATELPVRAIAARIGLQSDAGFGRLFKSAYGLSPSQYRDSIREQPFS